MEFLLGTTTLVILSVLFGLGIFLIFAAFAIPSVMGKRVIEEDGGIRIGNIAEAQVLSAMAADMGRAIVREKGDLSGLLRKSGFLYETAEEYYARRIYSSVLYAILAGVGGYFLDLGYLVTAGLVTAGLVYGFASPARTVQKAIKKRRERIQDEMGFGLEQLVNLLNTGTSLSDALSQMRDFGLFGKICDTVSSGLQTSKAIDKIIDDVLDSVPAPGQLKEFLGLIKQSQVGGEVQVNAMKTMARMLRQRLSNRIMEIGGQAKVKAVLVNTMIIVLASLIIIGVPGLALFMTIGFF
jgi:Flp pilus assembly protein TadB